MDLVTGPFRPSLERAFAETLAGLRKADPLAPLAVVAPSRRLANRLKEVALDALPQGFAAVRFFNLFSFARAIYDEAAPPGFEFLSDPLVPERLVATILRRHFRDEPYLSRAALAPRALLGALHELKAAGVDPDRALVACAEGELGEEEAPKLAEILSLHKRFADELRRRKLHERSDVVRVAAGHAGNSALLGSLRHVLYYGFYDLDQNQLDLLRAVVARVPATLFFPYEERPGFEYAKDFLETVVRPLASSSRVVAPDRRSPRVAQVAASGAHDEVWAAAKEILRLSDAGVPLAEIGVVARTLDPTIDLVESVFAEHRIPFVSSAHRKLGRDPAVQAARLLFSLDDFNRADVLDLLRSPFFRRRGGDPELWDQASRRMGIGRGADEWRRRLGAAAGRAWSSVRGERAERATFTLPRAEVDLFWSHVRDLVESPPPPAGWAAFADWALERHRRFLQPDDRVREAIESLAALDGFQMDDPLGALLERLASLSDPAGGKAGVQVLDAMAARGLPFRALLLLGMNEKVFPRFILEDAFVADAVRSRFTFRLGCRMPRKLEGYAEERLLFTLLMDSADEIVLLHQRSDDKGRRQLASGFLPAGEVRQVARRPAERLAEADLALLTPREASLRTGQGELVGRALGWDVSMLVEAAAFLRAVEARGPLTKYDGLVDTRHYWPALAGHGVSPTALERLRECPFKYFASKMLDLEELEEPEGEEDLQPVEIGQLYHDVLERLHRDGGDLERECDEAFARLEAARTIRYPVLWGVRKAQIRKTLRAFVDADDTTVFKPAGFEGELKGELPVAVAGRKGVVFRGYYDRLDAGPAGAFRVVDYKRRKSSKFNLSIEAGVFKKGSYLQPPVYFLLAALGKTEEEIAGSRFVFSFVEEALAEGTWEMALEGAEFWERRGEFAAKLAALLEAIPRGEFPIRPGNACRNCNFRTLCRKSHFPTRFRAEAHRRDDGGEEEDSDLPGVES